jgi:hypothetical protein
VVVVIFVSEVDAVVIVVIVAVVVAVVEVEVVVSDVVVPMNLIFELK